MNAKIIIIAILGIPVSAAGYVTGMLLLKPLLVLLNF
jgi:hypothetical protein